MTALRRRRRRRAASTEAGTRTLTDFKAWTKFAVSDHRTLFVRLKVQAFGQVRSARSGALRSSLFGLSAPEREVPARGRNAGAFAGSVELLDEDVAEEGVGVAVVIL